MTYQYRQVINNIENELEIDSGAILKLDSYLILYVLTCLLIKKQNEILIKLMIFLKF